MTRFVVDTSAVLHLASEGGSRSQARTSSSHRRSFVPRRCPLCTKQSSEAKIRLLGDAVLQRRAWELADQLGWDSTYDAEYVALTQLQADAFVTMDAKLARSVKAIAEIASVDALR